MSEARQAFFFDPPASRRRQTAPPGGEARHSLWRRFADRLVERPDLNRRIVSWQANKRQPGLRWFKYKEGFSADLVYAALRLADGPVLDPFAGAGTSVLIAGGANRQALGIEAMPVGVRVARAIACLAGGLPRGVVEEAGAELLEAVEGTAPAPSFRFPHVRITERAFPAATEDAIARARAFLHGMKDTQVRSVLDFACMSVLEETSYTRKDGQYLRWDHRCGRNLRSGMDKGPIPSFADALRNRLRAILRDAPQLGERYAALTPRIVEGSALRELARLAAEGLAALQRREDEAAGPLALDEDEEAACALFAILQTQWRRVDGLPVGLDYAAVPAAAQLAEIELNPDRFRCLRFMEGVAAEALRKRANPARKPTWRGSG